VTIRKTEPSEFRAGGRPLIAGFFGTAFGSSPVVYNVFPFVIGPIHEEFGWSFATIGLGIAVFGLVAAALAPVFGYLADTRGVRKVALWSLIGFAATFSLFALMPASLAAYFGIWALVGLVAIGSTPLTWSRAINLWFVKHRGAALGLMLVGTSATGIIVPQIMGAVVTDHGWRWAFPAAALLPLFVALPVCWFWFHEPATDKADPSTQPIRLQGLEIGQAIRGYRFWVMMISIICVATAYGGMYIHLGEIVILNGFGIADTATALGFVATGILIGRIGVGVLFDRFWAPAVAATVLLGGAVACLLFASSSPPFAMIAIAAFLMGLSSGAEADAIAYMAARYFGMKNYSRIYGFLYMPFAIGASISPTIYGIVRDQTGSYDNMLWVSAGLFALGGALFLVMGRYPDSFEKKSSEAKPVTT